MSARRGVQSVFRAANERLRESMEQLSLAGRHPVICECSDPDCMEVLELTPKAYTRVREEGNFIVARGHGDPEIEDVVASCDGYEVVHKRPVT